MRLFVSVSLTDEMKKCVLYHKNILKENSRRGRYPHSDNYHITLAFIGEYDDAEKVMRALRKVSCKPFQITAGGLSSFGSTYFVRATSENGILDAFAEAVRSELSHEGIPYDKKSFKAHITVGRDVECDNVPTVSRRCQMTVNSFSLMRSDVIGGKRIYRSLGEVRF